MKKRNSTWVTNAAAVAALVGGLGGVGHATTLSAGGFPGFLTSNGGALCMLTNAGTRDVVVNSVALLDNTGTVLDSSGSGQIVPPGQTRGLAIAFFSNASPSACTFDVSTKTGVRASFAYHDGSTFVVIPAVAR